MPSAIVINIPETENTCFIATPFSDEFEGVSTSIKEAATRLKLQPLRMKDIQPGVNFVSDIINKTQSARIVVAVCSPVLASNAPNPNVMYELGLAHALGKPTIILTSNIATLPADMKDYYVMEYDQEEARQTDPKKNKNFILRIKDAMSERINNSPDRLTDMAWESRISVVQSGDLSILNRDFWNDFQNIFCFGKKVYDEFQSIHTHYINDLRKIVEEIVCRASQELEKMVRFNDTWGIYEDRYQRINIDLFQPLQEHRKVVSKSFDNLMDYASCNDKRRGSYDRSRDCFNIITQRLLNYSGLHANINNPSGNFLPTLQNMTQATHLYGQLQQLSISTQSLCFQANSMILNLIEMIL